MDNRVIYMLRENPIQIAPLVGLDLLTPEIHNGWLQSMAFETGDYTLLGHRGSYKTSTLSLAISIIMITQPKKRILFVRKTDSDVIDLINHVDKILNTETFGSLAYRLYGFKLRTSATASKINTNLLAGAYSAPQLRGIGIGGSLTGKHADIIFTDDIVNVQDRISGAERERTKLAYMELQNIKNRGGRVFNTGTPWHKNDAISCLMPNKHRFDCYTTNLISPEQLQQLRDSMSPSLFAANYELKHIADTESLFKAPQLYSGDKSDIFNGISHVDAAFSGPDFTAFTVLKELHNGTFLVYGKLYTGHVDNHLRDISAKHEIYKAGTVYLETNADKGYLAEELRRRGLPVSTYHEKQNKYIKISTYLLGHWKSVKFLPGTDPDYINQILDFSEQAAHDDAPDSLASLIRITQNKVKLHHVIGGI